MSEQHMTDKELEAVLRAWTPDTPAGHPDRSRVVGNVVRLLHSTRPRRRRWWLGSAFRGTADAPKDAERRYDQASPIPATIGHTRTVTGRIQSMFSPVKAITAGALVFAIGGVMLIAQPFDQQVGSVPGAATDDPALAPSFYSGTLGDDWIDQRRARHAAPG